MTAELKDPLSRQSSLTVNRSSIKSRSSNCLADSSITPWLPGIHVPVLPVQDNPATTNDWANFSSSRPSRDETSSQSNSNYGAPWPSQRAPSDRQRLKGSGRKKKKGNKKKKGESMDDKDDDQLSPLGRKIIVFVAVFLFLLCILLVGVTLRLGPVIDEMVRKGNEEIYRSMTVGASTSSPTTDGAVVANNSTPPSGTPG